MTQIRQRPRRWEALICRRGRSGPHLPKAKRSSGNASCRPGTVRSCADGLALDRRAVQRRHRPEPLRGPRYLRSKAKVTGIALAIAMGLAGAQASAAFLTSIPADRLAERGEKFSLSPSFIVGDEAIPVPLLEAFQKGRKHPVPLFIGNNSVDANVVESFGVDPAVLVKKIGKARILVRSLYPGASHQSQLGREVARDALSRRSGGGSLLEPAAMHRLLA